MDDYTSPGETRRANTATGESRLKCDGCESDDGITDSEATWWCQQCDNHFCESCKRRHNQKELLKKHQMLGIENVKCSHHRDKVIAFYCYECQRCVCSKCIMTSCTNHHQDEISINNKHTVCQILNSIAKSNSDVLRDAKTRHQDVINIQKEAIDEQLEEAIAALRENAKTLKEELEKKMQIFSHESDSFLHLQDAMVKEIDDIDKNEKLDMNPMQFSVWFNGTFRNSSNMAAKMPTLQIPTCSFSSSDVSSLSLGEVKYQQTGQVINSKIAGAVKRSLSQTLLHKKFGSIYADLPAKLKTPLWKSKGVWCHDVTFVNDGRVAAMISSDKTHKVLLLNTNGSKKAEYSSEKKFNHIAYHPQLSSVILSVCDCNSSLTLLFLDADTLIYTRSVTLESTQLPDCEGMCVLGSGDIATTHHGCICIHTSEGKLFQMFNTPGINPMYITCDSEDNLYVTKYQAAGVQVYNCQGQLLHNLTEDLDDCSSVAVDDAGYIWLVEQRKKCVTVISSDGGKICSPLQELNGPEAIALHGTQLCVPDAGTKWHRPYLFVYALV